jgi:TfoX/Sxy family transcriptional regulator of competence genes
MVIGWQLAIKTARSNSGKAGESSFCDEKVIALVCNNQLFIKPTAGGRSMIGNVVEVPPYPGAKPHFLIEEQLDDQHWMSNLIQLTASEVRAPKPKKAKSQKAKI